MRALWADDERYVTLDEIIEIVQDARDTDDIEPEHVQAYIERHGLTPASCSICEREIEPDATIPLCIRCARSAKAHAQLEVARLEWLADGSPD